MQIEELTFVVMLSLQGEKCGIYGANCPEWIISMEVISSLYPSSLLII